jgi:hypothetical protein
MVASGKVTSDAVASDDTRESGEVLTDARGGVDDVAWWHARRQLRAPAVTPYARRGRGGEQWRSVPEGTR